MTAASGTPGAAPAGGPRPDPAAGAAPAGSHAAGAAGAPPRTHRRVRLWARALRVQHWTSVALIVIMSATGWYIMDPFFGPQPTGDTEAGYLMGWIRFIHIMAGFAWIGIGLWRVVLLFIGPPQSRWRSLWPFHGRRDLRGLRDTLLHYLFLKREGPVYLTHNPLQQIAYTGIYVLCLLQVLTGLALYGLYDQYNVFFVILSYPVHWLGVPTVRLLHAGIMFCLWVFVIGHVYLAVRSDMVERNGAISSMISGGLWLAPDVHPVDEDRVG